MDKEKNETQALWDKVFKPEPQTAAQFAKDVERLSETKASYPQPASFPTPTVYLALNGLRPNLEVKELMMTLTKDDTRKIMGFHQGKSFDHDLTLEQVQALPVYLSNPLIVVRDTDRSLVAIIDIESKTKNETYFVPIHLNKLYGRKISNEIASAYHRGNLKSWLGYDRADGQIGLEKDIVYIRQERNRESTRLSQTHGNQSTNEMLISLLGVGALKDLTNSRSKNSFPTEKIVLNSEDIVNFYTAKIAHIHEEKNHEIINLSGLSPREAGRALFKATQGAITQWDLMERSATAAGFILDKKAMLAVQGQHPLIIEDTLMKAVKVNVRHTQNEKTRNPKDITR
ncbi:hypothetical protein AKG33_03590 [Dichelobacter nodosus]|uniref:MuF-C-terminal domain-containing protein n=1 Tax=Dichelobacter nodosus TaxID=870 RepID=UPI0006832CA4|nr:hypothetical protein [Dichelobacter nodosus]KNZ39504.1 hypothetical protein AKG33_03590 [Dichelobacter nodosus]